jgi:hypothetical protein
MFSILLLFYYFMLLYITLLLYGTNYFILSEVCTRLRLKSVALMFFPCECKIVLSIQNVKTLCQIIKKEDKSEIYESTQYH